MATISLKRLLLTALFLSVVCFERNNLSWANTAAFVESDEMLEHASKIEAYKKKKAELQDKLDTIDKLKANQGNFALLLAELKSKAKPQVWIASLKYKNNNVYVVGYGKTLTAIGEWVETLQYSKYFSSVDYGCSLGRHYEDPDFPYPFEIKFRFDADPERIKKELEKKRQADVERKRKQLESKKRKAP